MKVSNQFDMDMDDEYPETEVKIKSKKKAIIIVSVIAAIILVLAAIVVAVVLIRNSKDKTTPIDEPLPNDPNSQNNSTDTNPDDDYPAVNPDFKSETITFKANGGNGNDVDVPLAAHQRIAFGETPQFTKADYALVGWCKTPDCQNSKVAFPYFFESAITLYANWKYAPKLITVSFHGNTGTGVIPSTQFSENQEVKVIQNGFRKSGYAFEGWCTDSDCTAGVINFPHKFTEDVTLYPKWTSITPKGQISFDGGGGTGDTLPLTCSDKMEITEAMVGHSFEPPSREMLFVGYTIKKSVNPSSVNLLSEENELVEFPYTFTENVIFSAVWKSPDYVNVTLVYENELFPKEIHQFTVNTELNDLAEPTLDNYLFAGWFTSPTYESDKQVAFPVKITNGMVFYAKIMPYSIDGTISYEPNGGYGSMISNSFHLGVVVTEPTPLFRNPGYDFKGWYSSPSCNRNERVLFPIYFNKSLTLYPKWSLNIPEGRCLLYYHLDPSEGLIESTLQVIDSNTMIYLPRPPKLERSDGAKFYAWATEKSNPWTYYSYFQAFTIDQFKVNSSGFINIYPFYTTDYYTITYNLETGERGDVSPVYIDKEMIKSNQIGLPYFIITKTDYVFRGWAKSKNGLAEIRPKHDLLQNSITSDMKLYAVFGFDSTNEGGNQPKYAGQTIWIKGIDPFPEERWVQRELYDTKTIVWKYQYDHNKWWDAKKRVPVYGGYDANMCWAAAASNALHWWYYHNSHYIAKYFELNPDSPKPATGFPNVKDSEIFLDFKKNWPNEGGYSNIGAAWWVSGSNRTGGGYFKDAFNNPNTYICETTTGMTLTRKRFNEFITQAIESDRALTWYTVEFGSHATTIYGAKYDTDGWIRTIYYADNNHIQYMTVTNEITSILACDIIYFDQDVQQPQPDLETNPEHQKNPIAWIKGMFPGYGVHIRELQSYDLRHDVWENYFAEKEKEKAKAM